MHRAFLAFSICLGLACAERQPLPPGEDLERAEAPVPALVADAGTSVMPRTSDRELARAWEPPPAAPAKEPSSQAPPEDEEAVDRALSAQAEAEARAKLKELLVGGRRSLSLRALDDAQAISVGALEVAQGLSPPELQQALQLSSRVALERGDIAGAVKAAERWLKTCGPEKVDACRGGALAALQAVGRLKLANPGTVNEKVKAVREADACVLQAEARRAIPPCLEAAVAHYRRQKDRLMLARVAWARAALALGDPKRAAEVDGLLRRAEAECTEVRCAAIRRKVLRAIAGQAVRSGDAEAAASATLKEMRLGAALLPADRRLYARAPEVDSVCAAYDAKAGAGSCRRLEKKLGGEWTFHDFSLGNDRGPLAADQVKTVNEHFNCLLQECLTLEADRLTPPDSVVYDVQWEVTNDGRVNEVHLARKDQEEGPMLGCLKKQFGLWRYPRYRGELQHVAQRFTVSAHDRHTR